MTHLSKNQLIIYFLVCFTYRKFPTVEKQCQQYLGDQYVGVLPDPQMARLLIQEIGFGLAGKKVMM